MYIIFYFANIRNFFAEEIAMILRVLANVKNPKFGENKYRRGIGG